MPHPLPPRPPRGHYINPKARHHPARPQPRNTACPTPQANHKTHPSTSTAQSPPPAARPTAVPRVDLPPGTHARLAQLLRRLQSASPGPSRALLGTLAGIEAHDREQMLAVFYPAEYAAGVRRECVREIGEILGVEVEAEEEELEELEEGEIDEREVEGVEGERPRTREGDGDVEGGGGGLEEGEVDENDSDDDDSEPVAGEDALSSVPVDVVASSSTAVQRSSNDRKRKRGTSLSSMDVKARSTSAVVKPTSHMAKKQKTGLEAEEGEIEEEGNDWDNGNDKGREKDTKEQHVAMTSLSSELFVKSGYTRW